MPGPPGVLREVGRHHYDAEGSHYGASGTDWLSEDSAAPDVSLCSFLPNYAGCLHRHGCENVSL